MVFDFQRLKPKCKKIPEVLFELFNQLANICIDRLLIFIS